MATNSTIASNSDFLFLYEAIQCNPNGDIDQENKPRMDHDTKTNLVSDVRIKRYIRDFLKASGTDIFVDMEGDNKVSPTTRLENIVKKILADDAALTLVLGDRQDLKAKFLETKTKLSGDLNKVMAFLKTGKIPGEKKDEKDKEKEKEEKAKKEKKWHEEFNYTLLAYLVKEKFIDIRFFGSAFAIEGFTKSYVGPIQLNWGYSLHKVELMDSNSIVTIMNDGNSTVGKDYRVHYSLLAFVGSINKFAAVSTGLSESDLGEFRKAIWQAIPALPTRSKLNQYPKLYVEIIYNDGYTNGQFGDLRQHISAKPKAGIEEKHIRKFDDLNLDLSKLKKLIAENKGDEKDDKGNFKKSIKSAIIKTSTGIEFKIEG